MFLYSCPNGSSQYGFTVGRAPDTQYGFGNCKPWGKDMKIIGVQPEFRYFFSGRTFHKMFVGIGGIGASYNVHWSGKVYDGQAIGLGMTFGYVLNLSQRLNLDFHAGFGGVYYKRKEYYENDQYDEDYSIGGVERANSQGYYLMRTRIGVSLSYIRE